MLMQYYVNMDMRIVIGACAIAVLVVVGLVAWRMVVRYRASREIFLKFDTMAGPLRVYTIRQDDDWVRVMDVQGTMQSATYLDDWRCYDLVYDYTKQYDHLFEAGKPEHGVLVLGGGGYSYPKHLISSHDDIAVAITKEKAVEVINEDFKNRFSLGLLEHDGEYYVYLELRDCDKWYTIEEINLFE